MTLTGTDFPHSQVWPLLKGRREKGDLRGGFVSFIELPYCRDPKTNYYGSLGFVAARSTQRVYSCCYRNLRIVYLDLLYLG